MKVDFTQVLTQLSNEPLMVDQDPVLDAEGIMIMEGGKPKMKGGKPATLGRIAVDALLGNYEDDKALDGSKKQDRYRLAGRIHEEVLPVELSDSEAELIRTLVCKAFTILTYGRVCDAIDKAKAMALDEKKKDAPVAQS